MKEVLIHESKTKNQKLNIILHTSHNSGITIVALIITIIVMLVLATVSINGVFGGEGIITKARESKFKSELTSFKENLELFKLKQQTITSGKFDATTLSASKNGLYYEPDIGTNKGTIKSVSPGLSKEFEESIEIIKGEIVFSSQNEQKLKWAQEVGVQINPYNIVDGVLLSSNTNLMLLGADGTLVIPSTVTKIAEGAFANVEGIKKVVIPGTVKEIGKNAFAYNTTLETVIMEDGVEVIESSAFWGCPNLTNVKMEDSVTTIGSQAFYSCRKLKNIYLSSNITVLHGWLFSNCQSLSIVNIPENVTTISIEVFGGCKSLTKITIPKSVTSIVSSAFRDCIALETIEIDPENQSFASDGGILFNKDRTEMIWVSSIAINENTFTVPSTVTTIGKGLINNYTNITKVVIPASTTSIDVEFFTSNIVEVEINSGNPNYLEYSGGIYNKDKTILYKYIAATADVILPDGLQTIGNRAFSAKGSTLTNISLPVSLNSIESFAFYRCIRLKAMSLGANIEYLDPLFIYGLDISVTIDENNPNYKVVDKAIYSKDGTKLITVIENPISFTIPTGVTEIGERAFHNKSKMTQVIIPSTVTKIGSSFNYCSSLTKIEIPSSVESIGSSCFGQCQNLKEIRINKSKDSITGSPWGATVGEKAVIWNE